MDWRRDSAALETALPCGLGATYACPVAVGGGGSGCDRDGCMVMLLLY